MSPAPSFTSADKPRRRRRRTVVGLALFCLLAFTGAAVGASQTVTGTLEVAHSDDFAGRKASYRYFVKTSGGRRMRVTFGRNRPRTAGGVKALGGSKLRIRGDITRSGRIVVRKTRVQRRARKSATTNAPVTKKVAVIMFNFANDARQPYTADAVRSTMFTGANSVNAYFTEESYGRLKLAGKTRSDGDVLGWYTIPHDNTGCDYLTWGSAANSKANAAGVDLSGYDNLVYVFPSAGGCGWAGLAYMPGKTSYINGAFNLRVVGHEVSHNYGVHHASSLSCQDSAGQRVAISGTCSQSEYGDPFTIMGAASTRHANNFHIAQFGWLSSSNTQTASTTGTYTLTPIQYDSTAPQVLRIPRTVSSTGAVEDYYYLEYRQPFGTYFDNFSATDPAVTGVSVRIGPAYSVLTQPLLLDTNPSTSSFSDAPLAAGRTFTDAAKKISIATVGVTSVAATVKVSLGADSGGNTTDTSVPTPPANLTAQASSTPSVTLSWSASSDNVGVTGYDVYRDGAKIASTAATTYSDAAVTASSTYTYRVVARDAAGNVSPASNQASATVPAPTTLKANPSSYYLYGGSVYSGAVGNLAANDGVFFRLASTATSPRVDGYGSIAAHNSLKSLSITYVGKNTQTCQQALMIYNWTTSTWQALDTRLVGTTKTAIQRAPSGTLAEYVSGTSGAGFVRLRVRCTGPSTSFRSEADLMRAIYTV